MSNTYLNEQFSPGQSYCAVCNPPPPLLRAQLLASPLRFAAPSSPACEVSGKGERSKEKTLHIQLAIFKEA